MCRCHGDHYRRCKPTPASLSSGRAAASRYYQRGKARRTIATLADEGIPAVDDLDMPSTYHRAENGTLDLGKPPLELSNEHAGTGNEKPIGALWSSPGRVTDSGGVRTTWSDYSAMAADGDPNTPTRELKAQPGAVIVHISSAQDAENLLKRYQTDGERGPGFDWVAMRKDGIDGVYVDDRAITQARSAMDARYTSAHPSRETMTTIEGFRDWDASSVAWLSNENVSNEGGREPGGYVEEEKGPDDEYMPTRYEFPDDYGTSVRPERPDLDTAWERVPKRFQPKEQAAKAPAAEAPSTQETTQEAPPAPAPETPSTVYRPTTSGGSGEGRDVSGADLLGMGLEVVKAARSGKKKSKGAKSSPKARR